MEHLMRAAAMCVIVAGFVILIAIWMLGLIHAATIIRQLLSW